MNKTDELRTARIDSLVTPAELASGIPCPLMSPVMLLTPDDVLKRY